jgi:hypothetical protein
MDLNLYDVEFFLTKGGSGRAIVKADSPGVAKVLVKNALIAAGRSVTNNDVYDVIYIDINDKPKAIIVGVS